MSPRDLSGLMTRIVPPRGPSSESQFQLSASVKGVSCFIDCVLCVLSTDLLYKNTRRSDMYPLHTVFNP